MTVTTDQVYREILDELQDGVTDLDASVIYLNAEPRFDIEAARVLQVIPGTPQSQHPRSGVGLIVEEFRVVCWGRVLLDRSRRGTVRYTDEQVGLMETMEQVRSTLIQNWLNDGTEDVASIPVLLIRGGVPSENDAHPGWGYIEDTYRVGYEIAWVQSA